ncbi:MAG: histidine kinase dimerization/phosphoacceptor domain -containing protein [Pseudomonadota bacterium]
MSEQQPTNDIFSVFKEQYNTLLEKFLNTLVDSESILHEGYKLGRQAVDNNIGILNVVAIHQDCLVSYLEKLETNEHLIISEKANGFLEEILASFQMVETNFRQAITLLNQRSLEFAGRVRALQDSIHEKEALLKEVYHRVKNNLQVVSSLLSLQAGATEEVAIQKVLLESSSRVKSMALVHEMLYQTENLASIAMKSYIVNLFKYLFQIYKTNVKNVQLDVDIDDITLSIDLAIPCGLIINELVSNVIKHAFPNDKLGIITFSFKKQDHKIVLTLRDNGVGIPSEIDIQNTASLGMRLIHSLTKQLDGNILLNRANGTAFTLTFKVD